MQSCRLTGRAIGATLHAVLPEAQEVPPKVAKRPKRRWLYAVGIFFALIVIAVLWLSGPGLRLLAPKAASHFLEKVGMTSDFQVKGNLTGGLTIENLKLEGQTGALEKLTIDRVTPLYEFSRLIKGEVIGLEVEGAHADLRIGEETEEEKPPLDLQKLVQTIRNIRAQVVPLKLDLKRISVSAKKQGEFFFGLEPSSISHEAGTGVIALDLGKISAIGGQEFPQQRAEIIWETDRLLLDQLNPYPGIGVRDLVLDLPETGDPKAQAQILVDDAAFDLQTAPGFSAATLGLKSGALQIEETAKRFGVEIPAKARLTSLSLSVDGILPDPTAATGLAQIVLENVEYQDWQASEVTLGTTLDTDKATVALRARTLETPVSLDAEAPVSRLNGKFLLGDTAGTFSVAEIAPMLRALAERFPAIKEDAPESSLTGSFRVAFDQNKPQSADADLLLKPADEKVASSIAITGRWAPDEPVSGEAVLDGLKVGGSYDLKAKTYRGSFELAEFTNTRIDRWLDVVGVKAGGVANVSARWTGAGDLVSAKHRGDLLLSRATWNQPEKAEIVATGSVKYDWPTSVEASDLVVQSQNQTVKLDAGLAGGLLELRKFSWADGDTEMAGGTASLPVPADFSKWRETLAADRRPVSVAIESRVLSLAVLKPWVPAAAQLDPASTGHVKLNVSGTYAEPVVEALVEALNLRSPTNTKIPPADLKISLIGREGKLTVDGTVTTPDFAPATIKATTGFRPADWATAPDLIKEEAVEARVDLPRLDLSRFSTLVPAAKKITGILTGHLAVNGKLGKPEIRGEIDLANGSFVSMNRDLPPVTGVAASVDATLNGVNLKTLRATVAGGTLQGEGSLPFVEGKPGAMNVRLRASHLPIIRNDLMIVRANADLRLQGPFATAALTGSVGIVDSLFYRDIELLPIGKPFTGPAAAKLPKVDTPKNPTAGVPEPFRNWTLNVTARTEDPFLIRGNLGTGQATANLRIGGTIGNPAPTGEVKIRNGVASLPFSTLLVRSGTLRFTPEGGFNPTLEIRGTAEPRPYRVDVYVYGQLSDPQLVLTSNPPLPENEIMTLLATGTTTSGLENTQAASSRALQLLIEEARRGRVPFAKQLRPLLKLADRIDFNLAEADPYDSDQYSTATVRLTDRWFVSAGMGSEGDTRILGIWRISFR